MDVSKSNMGFLLLKIKAGLSTASAVIVIRSGKAILLKGSVSASILTSFSDVARLYAIERATITVRKDRGALVLRFSGKVPGPAMQRFRNVWFSYPERKVMGV